MDSCLTCSDHLTLEELLRLVIVCNEGGTKGIRLTEVEGYTSDCIACSQYFSLQEIFRDAMFCDIAGIHSVQVQTYSGIDAATCVDCASTLTTEELLKDCLVCLDGVLAFRVLLVPSAEPCEGCGLFQTIDEAFRRLIVCDANGVKYIRVTSVEGEAVNCFSCDVYSSVAEYPDISVVGLECLSQNIAINGFGLAGYDEIIELINSITGEEDTEYIDALNSLCVFLGGEEGHEETNDAINEIGSIVCVSWVDSDDNLEALNAIATCLGGEAGHETELQAWQEIESIGFISEILAPSSLLVIYLSSTSVRCSWTINSDNHDGCKVYKSTDNVTYTLAATVTGSTATADIADLTTDELYYFKVVAYKGSTESTASNTVLMFTADSSKTVGFYLPYNTDNVVIDESGRESIWWDLIHGKNQRGEEESSGSLIQWGIYEITATQESYFYNGCAVGNIFSCWTVKTLDSNNKVKRVLGNHLGQFTANNKPVRSSGAPCATFNGTSHLLRTAPFTWVQPEIIYGIIKQITWTANDFIFDGANWKDAGLSQYTATPGLKASAQGSNTTTSDLALNSWGVIKTLFNGANSLFQINNQSAVNGNFGSGNAGQFTVGGTWNGAMTKFANMEAMAFILRNVADDSTVQSKISTYLQSLLPEIPVLTATPYLSDTINLSAAITGSYDLLSWEISTDDGVNYTEDGTTAYGTTTYIMNGLTASTAYKFRCRTLKNGVYSEYSNIETKTTYRSPISYNIDTSSVKTVTIQVLNITSGKTIVVDWGDGTNNSFTGNNTNIVKTYSGDGPYTMKLGGNINGCSRLDLYDQSHVRIDMTDFVLPTDNIIWHCYNLDTMGVFPSGSVLNALQQIWHVGRLSSGSGMTGDITDVVMPTPCRDFHMEYHDFTGDLTDWVINDNAGHIYLTGNPNITGDLSAWTIPSTMTALRLKFCPGLEGDLSSINIPVMTSGYGFSIDCQSSHFTGAFRGAFEYIDEFLFNDNYFNQAEIDSVLAAIEARLTSYPPHYDCVYDFSGANMGTPTDSGIAARIEALYTAAGKSCTFSVNS